MVRLIGKKCARSLIVVKVAVVKVGPDRAVVKTHADLVQVVVKTHADPAKAIGINLVLNAVTPRAC
jgi:hypothetical protein